MISSVSNSSNDMAAQMWSQLIKNDKDTDSKLNKAEMQAALANMPLPPSNATRFEDIFKLTDSNNDGSISKDEFSTYMKSHQPPTPPSNGGISFDNLQEKLWQSLLTQTDTNKDSTISSSELDSLFSSKTSSVSETDKANLFSNIDTDKNGQITKDEFSVYLETNKPTEHPHNKPASVEPKNSATDSSVSKIQDELWKALMQTDLTQTDGNTSFSSFLIEQLKSYASTYAGQSTNVNALASAEFSA